MTHKTVLSCFHSASMAVRTILYFTVLSTRQILSFQVQRVRPVSETNNFEVLILSKKNIRIVTPIISVMTSRDPGVPKIFFHLRNAVPRKPNLRKLFENTKSSHFAYLPILFIDILSTHANCQSAQRYQCPTGKK